MDYTIPLSGCNCPICQTYSLPLPFETEPAAETVYTHVLLDFNDQAGYPWEWSAQLHTAESVLDAIALRKGGPERYQVFELGECILDVSGE